MLFFLYVRFSILFLFWFLDFCKVVNCKYYFVCKLKFDGFMFCECFCLEECLDVNDFVCGMNGKMYESECKLKVESCVEGIDVIMKYNGVCGMKIIIKNMFLLICFFFLY